VFVCLFRLIELNSRVVCGLSVGEFTGLVTSSSLHNEQPCRVVVLRDTVERGHESSTSLA